MQVCYEKNRKHGKELKKDMKKNTAGIVKTAKIGYFILSAALCVMGILFILWPASAAAVTGIILGAVITAFGIIRIIGYFSRDLFRLAFQYDLELGILCMIFGILMMTKTEESLSLVFVLSGILAITDSLFKIRICMDAKKFGISLWWMLLMTAILTGAAGVVLAVYPWTSVKVVTVILGISLLAEGILNIFVAAKTVNTSAGNFTDPLDVEFSERL